MTHDFEGHRRLNDPVAALPCDAGKELAQSLRIATRLRAPALFIDVALWAQRTLGSRDFDGAAIVRTLDAIGSNLASYVSVTQLGTARAILSAARDELAVAHLPQTPPIDESSDYGRTARRFIDAILDDDERKAAREVLLCIAQGTGTIDIYERVLTPVLREAGEMWNRNEIGISQEHLVTAAVERVMAQLIDLSAATPYREYSIVSAAPSDAQHALGARMVADNFALCGWHAAYLGANIPTDDLLDYVDRVSVDVLAISATLARDLEPVARLISELQDRPVAPLVLVGGRAFSLDPTLWQQIGADGYAATPLRAVALANELVCSCVAD
ncbi:MAG TPA: cobalamin-dependent protein [Candidatus Baltobacteraceae bacterium]|jgi:methanogenic corrinoid protein MtbC1|nr:cobalamin-dependent protein [Candidatus Baltobacteraceae bacterium]